MNILLLTVQLLFVPLVAPLCIGVIRKLKASLQNRRGASVLQPYRDFWKLLHKDEARSRDASWIFSFAPIVVFATSLLLGAIVPLSLEANIFSILGDFLVVVYIVALGTFFIALGGLDVGNAFGDIGSSREMTFAAIVEGGVLFSFLPVAIVSGSTNLLAMFTHVQTTTGKEAIVVAISGLAFFIALLAENARYPFDNPSTHLELTMVHEAMIIEHSGKGLALMEWGSANKLVIFLLLAVNVFVPWGGTFDFLGTGVFATLGATFLKLLLAAGIVALIESSMPKLRFFRLPELLFTSFALGVTALVIAVI